MVSIFLMSSRIVIAEEDNNRDNLDQAVRELSRIQSLMAKVGLWWIGPIENPDVASPHSFCSERLVSEVLQSQKGLSQEILTFQSILDDIIGKHTADQRTQNTMQLIKKSRCPSTLGQCMRFVQKALRGCQIVDKICESNQSTWSHRCRNGYLDRHYNFIFASQFDYPDHEGDMNKSSYEDHSPIRDDFVNLFDFAPFALSRLEEAPIGSIIVYDSIGKSNSPRPGHIEIVTTDERGNRMYCSDYCSNVPRSPYSFRPTSVLIKVENQDKKKLMDQKQKIDNLIEDLK